MLFLLLSRPYEDEVFQTYEIITTFGQLAMMIVVALGYFQVYPPQGTFIGIVAFILVGQIGKQACCCHTSIGRLVRRAQEPVGPCFNSVSSFCVCAASIWAGGRTERVVDARGRMDGDVSADLVMSDGRAVGCTWSCRMDGLVSTTVVVAQLHNVAQDKIMLALEFADALLSHSRAYRHLQETTMAHILR